MSFHQLKSYFLFSLLLVAMACSKNQPAPQGPPPVSVVVQPVKASATTYYDEYPAIVRALNEVELRAQVNGYITGIHFAEGTKVKKGQKLYSIDQQQYEATYQQAQANLQVQEANLEKALKDVERYRELSKRDAIAKQQVDYAEATYAAAKQQVEASRAAVKSVQTNVRYTSITAPFDGTIGISNVRLGAAVSAGQTLLNTISSDDPMAADISIDQKEIFRFAELQKLDSNVKTDSTFRLAFGDQTYPAYGRISVIDRAVDAQTGSIRARLVFPNADHALRSGMSGTLKVLTASQASLLVPYKAVTEQLGEFFLYVVDSSKVSQRKVILGKQIGRQVIIREGLKDGETIVVEGVQNLREGSAITIAPPPENKKTEVKK